MEWISVKDRRPNGDIIAMVCNEKRSWQVFKAMYHVNDDIFILLNSYIHEHPVIDVTHWFEIPNLCE